MKNTTLLFLVKKDGEVVTDICLAMKKRGFGAGRYNGVGGKVEDEETIEDAVRREAEEEIKVRVGEIKKVGEITFIFPHKKEWNQLVHVYITDMWEGVIVETEEMNPFWFKVENIPYKEMWPDDIFWLPKVLEGKYVIGSFTFGEGDVVITHTVTTEKI